MSRLVYFRLNIRLQQSTRIKVLRHLTKNLSTFCFYLILQSSAYASQDVIKIGVENLNYKPIIWFEDGFPKGFIPELLLYFSKETGQKYSITPFPVSRLKKEANEGKIDVQFPDNPNWRVDTNKSKSYSIPVVPYTDGYFAKNHDLFVEAVGTPLGFTVVALPKWSIDIANATTLDSLFSMLDKNRIDAIYLNTTVASNLKDSFSSDIVWREDMPVDRSFFYFSSSNSSRFIEALNSFINSNSELIAKLLESHGLTNKIEKQISTEGYRVGYGVIPSAPDFTDFSDNLNPYRSLTKLISSLVISPMATANNEFCEGKTVAVFPSFEDQINCPHHFQKIFSIRTYWITNNEIVEPKSIGLISGVNYDNLELPKNIKTVEVDNDLQLINLFRAGEIESIIIERENLLNNKRNLKYKVVKEYSLPVGISVANDFKTEFKNSLRQ